jgi:O-antigen ligase
LIDETTGLATVFGHGVGTADQLVMDDLLIPPHNDYLRIYYDLGLTGVVLYLAVVVSIWRNAWAVESGDRDIVLIVLLMMLSFAITDNFLYVSNRLFLLTFIGSCFAARTKELSPPVAALAHSPQVLTPLPAARKPGITLP